MLIAWGTEGSMITSIGDSLYNSFFRTSGVLNSMDEAGEFLQEK